MKSALLVVDVQNALCAGAYAVFDAGKVIERINDVAAKARIAGAPVIFIQHESSDGVLNHGSEGWQLAKGLHALPTDMYVGKKASDSFHHTGLEAILKAANIQQVVVCGLQSDFCVDSTTRRALALGFPVTLVADGHSTLDNDVLTAVQIISHHNVTLANLTSYGPRATPIPASDIRFSS